MGFGQDGYRNDTVNTEYVSGVITVGTTQVLACANGSTNLEGRQELIIFNKSIKATYLMYSQSFICYGFFRFQYLIL